MPLANTLQTSPPLKTGSSSNWTADNTQTNSFTTNKEPPTCKVRDTGYCAFGITTSYNEQKPYWKKSTNAAKAHLEVVASRIFHTPSPGSL